MKRVVILLLVVIALFSMTVISRAQTAAGYDVSWWTIDSGGNLNTTGGAYSMSGASGQPDASVAQGSGYTLSGGFWRGVSSVPSKTSTPTATSITTSTKTPTRTATSNSTPSKTSTPTATLVSNPSKTPTPTATSTSAQSKIYLPIVKR